MDPGDRCCVDECDRRAAVSVVPDGFPGPIRLCATHTEDFRLNGVSWGFDWDAAAGVPASVRTAPAAAVGRGPSFPGDQGVVDHPLSANRAGRLLSSWRRRR